MSLIEVTVEYYHRAIEEQCSDEGDRKSGSDSDKSVPLQSVHNVLDTSI